MTIRIATEDGDNFDAITSADVLSSVVRSSEASFEVGDDGSYRDIAELANLGTRFVAFVDETPRLRGRVEVLNSDVNARASSTIRFVVRTAISDLETNEVDLSIRVRDATIQQVIEAAVARKTAEPAPAIPAPRIIYTTDVARSIMTGMRGRGGKTAKTLQPLTEQEAAPHPGETQKAFIDRHLMRHGLLIWDGPDGELVVGEPDDEQEPIYFFRCLLGPQGAHNNCVIMSRTRDAGGAPTHLTIYGHGGGGGKTRSKISAVRTNDELISLGFDRRITLTESAIRTKDMAERTAARQFSERVRKVETVTISAIGHSFEDGGTRAAYAPDTVADLIFETLGGPLGPYYLEQTMARVSPSEGETTQIQLVRAGTWSL